ncbi:hypothetical protein NE579_16705, partial [Intestinimonas massiliensis]
NFTDQTKNKPKLVKNEKKLKTVLFLGKGGITLAAHLVIAEADRPKGGGCGKRRGLVPDI